MNGFHDPHLRHSRIHRNGETGDSMSLCWPVLTRFWIPMQAPEAFPPRWPEWIRTEERKPTAEDANEDGCVLSINMNRGVMNTTTWPWNVVAAFPDCLPVWMPLPQKPDLKEEHFRR